MPTIDWSRAGSAGEECACSVVVGFTGRGYCDGEILGSYDPETDSYVGGVSQEIFDQWIEDNIDLDLRNGESTIWTREESSRIRKTMVNGLGPGPADVIASYRTARGDRIEYYIGRGGEVEGDACCLLQTASGHVLIAGCAVGHPYCCCDILDFGNSDGSSSSMALDGTSGGALVRSLVDCAREYLYNQVH